VITTAGMETPVLRAHIDEALREDAR